MDLIKIYDVYRKKSISDLFECLMRCVSITNNNIRLQLTWRIYSYQSLCLDECAKNNLHYWHHRTNYLYERVEEGILNENY